MLLKRITGSLKTDCDLIKSHFWHHMWGILQKQKNHRVTWFMSCFLLLPPPQLPRREAPPSEHRSHGSRICTCQHHSWYTRLSGQTGRPRRNCTPRQQQQQKTSGQKPHSWTKGKKKMEISETALRDKGKPRGSETSTLTSLSSAKGTRWLLGESCKCFNYSPLNIFMIIHIFLQEFLFSVKRPWIIFLKVTLFNKSVFYWLSDPQQGFS